MKKLVFVLVLLSGGCLEEAIHACGHICQPFGVKSVTQDKCECNGPEVLRSIAAPTAGAK